MKKTLAVILSIVMLFGVLSVNTFAANAQPTVSVVTNQGSPLKEGDKTHFTVRLDNFSSIKGIDITIGSQDNSLVFTAVTCPSITLVEGENYKFSNDNKVLRILDLTNFETLKFTVDTTVMAESKVITVRGDYAKDGKNLFNIAAQTGVLETVVEIPTEEVQTSGSLKPEEVVDTKTTYIPYGGVYKTTTDEQGKVTYTHAEKNDDGSFNIPEEGYQYQTITIPENKITTFGASDDLSDATSIRFGSYSGLYDGETSHGTMVFDGDWKAFKEYYIEHGYTIQQLLDVIYKNYDETMAKDSNYTHVKYKIPDTSEYIYVYKFAQTKYMWRDTENQVIEFALRLKGIKEGGTYTGVAYSYRERDDKLVISDNVKSITR